MCWVRRPFPAYHSHNWHSCFTLWRRRKRSGSARNWNWWQGKCRELSFFMVKPWRTISSGRVTEENSSNYLGRGLNAKAEDVWNGWRRALSICAVTPELFCVQALVDYICYSLQTTCKFYWSFHRIAGLKMKDGSGLFVNVRLLVERSWVSGLCNQVKVLVMTIGSSN